MNQASVRIDRPYFWQRLGMPLLGKELVELAAQRRTYWTRVIYAGLFFLVCGASLASQWRYMGRYPGATFGLGHSLFKMVVGLQFAGVHLFVPALLADALAAEKERGSLGLLFLTELKPWSLLLQKYLARLVPVFSLLLLALPLMGIAYALGGLEPDRVLAAGVLLAATAFQAAALTLACSAWCASTVGTTLAAYVISALFYLGPPILAELSNSYHREWCLFLGAYYFDRHLPLAEALLPLGGSTVLFLVLARLWLTRRAFVAPRNLLLGQFRRLDALFQRWNQAWGNRQIRFLDHIKIENDPVAWRETYKRLLGSPHHLLRLLLLIEIPCVWLGLMSLVSQQRGTVSVLIGALWVVAALTLSVQGANLIASERTGQTLQVLLTTPLDGDDIVLQKMTLLQRLRWVFIVPIGSLALLRLLRDYDGEAGDIGYALATGLALVIYPKLLCWLGLLVGLRSRKKSRAVLSVLGLVVAWCLAPALVALAFRNSDEFLVGLVLLQSPAGIIGCNEMRDWPQGSVLSAALSFMFASLGVYLLRRQCIAHADHWLRRE